MEEFTDEEKKTLEPFMTNIDKPIFVLVNLPEVVKGALFSRYSRSNKSLRRVLLDDFILQPETSFREIVGHAEKQGIEQSLAIKKAEEFYNRILVGYGDDSIAELASTHIAIEDLSNVATKFIEDSRIGLSPLEKSTRYVYFDQQRNGKWLYYREPAIMQSEFAEKYEETCNKLFETYSTLIPKISSWVTEKNPQGEESERAYKAATRAKTCDILRGLLPASTLTNMGAMGNGRAFEYLLTKMYACDLQEMQDIANAMYGELGKVIPSFVKRAGEKHGIEMQGYLSTVEKNMWQTGKNYEYSESGEEVKLVDYDENAEEKIAAYALYHYTSAPLKELMQKAKQMSVEERERIISNYVGQRGNRRQKPGRAFENFYYTFDILANFGAYRDLQRHRALTQERQLISCRHGYSLPKEIVEAGFESEYQQAMQIARQTWEEISAKMPGQAQYVVPLAFKIRWYFTFNLREAFHLCELRSMQQGHPDYRKIAQQMYREINRVHPSLGKHMNFVDLKEYKMERIEAEKKLDKKLEEMEKNSP